MCCNIFCCYWTRLDQGSTFEGKFLGVFDVGRTFSLEDSFLGL